MSTWQRLKAECDENLGMREKLVQDVVRYQRDFCFDFESLCQGLAGLCHDRLGCPGDIFGHPAGGENFCPPSICHKVTAEEWARMLRDGLSYPGYETAPVITNSPD